MLIFAQNLRTNLEYRASLFSILKHTFAVDIVFKIVASAAQLVNCILLHAYSPGFQLRNHKQTTQHQADITVFLIIRNQEQSRLKILKRLTTANLNSKWIVFTKIKE